MNLGWGTSVPPPYYLHSHSAPRSLNIHSVHGPVINPVDTSEQRSAGGSSGGSAAAVAAGMCDALVRLRGLWVSRFKNITTGLLGPIQEVLFGFQHRTVVLLVSSHHMD